MPSSFVVMTLRQDPEPRRTPSTCAVIYPFPTPTMKHKQQKKKQPSPPHHLRAIGPRTSKRSSPSSVADWTLSTQQRLVATGQLRKEWLKVAVLMAHAIEDQPDHARPVIEKLGKVLRALRRRRRLSVVLLAAALTVVEPYL